MSVSRSTSLRTLNKLAAGSKQVRHLHMTGPATFPSPLLTTEPPTAATAKAIAATPTTKLPSADSTSAEYGAPKRHFNTSRSLKAVNDSSTIDFAYLPAFEEAVSVEGGMRVPLLPESYNPKMVAREVEETIIRPAVSTVGDSSVVNPSSAIAEVNENSAVSIDFKGMADRIATAAKRISQAPIEEQGGMIKQVWNGLVDDILGPKGPKLA